IVEYISLQELLHSRERCVPKTDCSTFGFRSRRELSRRRRIGVRGEEWGCKRGITESFVAGVFAILLSDDFIGGVGGRESSDVSCGLGPGRCGGRRGGSTRHSSGGVRVLMNESFDSNVTGCKAIVLHVPEYWDIEQNG